MCPFLIPILVYHLIVYRDSMLSRTKLISISTTFTMVTDDILHLVALIVGLTIPLQLNIQLVFLINVLLVLVIRGLVIMLVVEATIAATDATAIVHFVVLVVLVLFRRVDFFL